MALKERGIDKLVEDAREDNKDNDAAFLGRKKCELFQAAFRLTLTCWAGPVEALDSELDGVLIPLDLVETTEPRATLKQLAPIYSWLAGFYGRCTTPVRDMVW